MFATDYIVNCTMLSSRLLTLAPQYLIFFFPDALATVMGDEEKELCKPAQIALVLILETATCIMGSKERACQLPLFVYMAEKMCALCYERAWYSKLGGCTAIKFMFERMGRRWILQHQFMFLKALVFVMMDLTSEVWLFNSF